MNESESKQIPTLEPMMEPIVDLPTGAAAADSQKTLLEKIFMAQMEEKKAARRSRYVGRGMWVLVALLFSEDIADRTVCCERDCKSRSTS